MVKAARFLIPPALCALLAASCGLDSSGLEGSGDDASVADSGGTGDEFIIGPGDSAAGPDAPAFHNDSGSKDTGAPKDSGNPKDAPGDVVPTDSTAPCLGTTTSCGTPGSCVDCTNSPKGNLCVAGSCGCMHNPDCASSPMGTACVSGVCGCNDPVRDCPTGYACSSAHLCTTTCSGGLTCHGGCCDGTNCLTGNDNGACGNNGNSCQPCGGQTPTCAVGQCNGRCGSTGDGTCGTGFCCNAGMCADDTQSTTCGSSGMACTDCTNAPEGKACTSSGTCGCGNNGDCNNSSRGHSCVAGQCT